MFKLLYIKLVGHPQLGNLEMDLVEETEIGKYSKPYTTVIIGPNGTGKSFILKTIADIFRQFQSYLENENKGINLPFNLHLRYKYHHNIFEIVSRRLITYDRSGVRRSYLYYKNRPNDRPFQDSNAPIELITGFEVIPQELEFPKKIIVSSIMLNDRFTFADSFPDDFYQYLGIRKTASSTSTRSFSHRTVRYLFDASKTKEFLSGLASILNFLGFQHYFRIQYTTRYNRLFFSGNLEKGEFSKFFKEWWNSEFTKREKDSIPYSSYHFKNLEENNPERIEELINYLNYISQFDTKIIHKPNSSSRILELDLFKQEPLTIFEYYNKDKEYDFIEDLIKLDIIHLSGIKIKKEENALSIDQTSSGEYHLIISLLAIYSRIQESSLILIDEPEISLHPNWQMKYVSFLKQMFQDYNSCHFILTSHSHFLISDLEGENSAVVAISRDGELGKLRTELLHKNTYGWSAEEVLIKVFKTASDRNYFLADRIGEVLELISTSDINEYNPLLARKIDQLREIDFSGLSDEDPLKVIVTKIFNKL